MADEQPPSATNYGDQFRSANTMPLQGPSEAIAEIAFMAQALTLQGIWTNLGNAAPLEAVIWTDSRPSLGHEAKGLLKGQIPRAHIHSKAQQFRRMTGVATGFTGVSMGNPSLLELVLLPVASPRFPRPLPRRRWDIK